jgi:hypothetical protein
MTTVHTTSRSNKTLQAFERVGKPRKEFDRAMCGRRSRNAGPRLRTAAESTEPPMNRAKRIQHNTQRDGVAACPESFRGSASRFTLIGPARLSSGRQAAAGNK